MSAKQATSDKLQGSVATYLRCAGVVNNQIKKGLLLSLQVNFFKSLNIWQSYKQERDCFVHFLRLSNRLRFDRIIVMSLRPRLLAHPVYYKINKYTNI